MPSHRPISSHHEVSNPVLLITKEVFCLSNSGGMSTARTTNMKKVSAALPLSYRPWRTDWDSNPEPAD